MSYNSDISRPLEKITYPLPNLNGHDFSGLTGELWVPEGANRVDALYHLGMDQVGQHIPRTVAERLEDAHKQGATVAVVRGAHDWEVGYSKRDRLVSYFAANGLGARLAIRRVFSGIDPEIVGGESQGTYSAVLDPELLKASDTKTIFGTQPAGFNTVALKEEASRKGTTPGKIFMKRSAKVVGSNLLYGGFNTFRRESFINTANIVRDMLRRKFAGGMGPGVEIAMTTPLTPLVAQFATKQYGNRVGLFMGERDPLFRYEEVREEVRKLAPHLGEDAIVLTEMRGLTHFSQAVHPEISDAALDWAFNNKLP